MSKNLLDHDYDGIQELDNPLPGWWLATFYGAIAFAGFYILFYHVFSNYNQREEVSHDLAKIQEAQNQNSDTNKGPSEEKLLAALALPETKVQGHAVFSEKCFSCHGPEGQGGIGPNLTDSFWIHGDGKPQSIAKTVFFGVPEKGMPPWRGLLKEQELLAVVAFVSSLHGTKPANPKAPQGTEIRE